MEFNYQLNCGQYVLHQGDKPIHRVLDEVSLVFDKECGALYKHGAPEAVQKWLTKTQAKFRAGGFDGMAETLVCITGRFELDDLNRCLSTTGYVRTLYERLQAGELASLSFTPAPSANRPDGARKPRHPQ